MTVTPDFWEGAQVNSLFDPGFESGALRYDYRLEVDVTDGSFVSPLNPLAASYSFRQAIAANAAIVSGSRLLEHGWSATAMPGQAWSFSALCGAVGAHMEGLVGLAFLGEGGDTLLAQYSEAKSSGPPTTLYVDGLVAPPETSKVMALCAIAVSVEKATGSVAWDQRCLTQTPSHVECFDGDTPGAFWQGGRFWSYSQRYGLAGEETEFIETIAPEWFFAQPNSTVEVF